MLVIYIFISFIIGLIIGIWLKPNGDEIFDRIELLDEIANGTNQRIIKRKQIIKKYREKENKRKKVKLWKII